MQYKDLCRGDIILPGRGRAWGPGTTAYRYSHRSKTYWSEEQSTEIAVLVPVMYNGDKWESRYSDYFLKKRLDEECTMVEKNTHP